MPNSFLVLPIGNNPDLFGSVAGNCLGKALGANPGEVGGVS